MRNSNIDPEASGRKFHSKFAFNSDLSFRISRWATLYMRQAQLCPSVKLLLLISFLINASSLPVWPFTELFSWARRIR